MGVGGQLAPVGYRGRGESAVKQMAQSSGLSFLRALGFLLHHHCSLSFRGPPPNCVSFRGVCQTWLCPDKGGAMVAGRIK